MALLKVAALGALGYVGYKYYESQKRDRSPAFADNQSSPGNDTRVRNAGPDAMADGQQGWNKVDEQGDESFPASDPPANY